MLLIDMQDDFLEDIDAREKEREIPNMLRVLEYAGDHKIPLIVLEYKGHEPTIKELRQKIDSLPTTVIYITKLDDSGFYNTGLEARLKNLRINNLVLMGINATGCVMRTAESALNHGFRIFTSLDLIAQPSSWVDDQDEGKEGSVWYKKHGTLAKDHHDLLRIISEKYVQKSP